MTTTTTNRPTPPTRVRPWQDAQGRERRYPQAWAGHWFDNGQPSMTAKVNALATLMSAQGGTK